MTAGLVFRLLDPFHMLSADASGAAMDERELHC